MKPFNQLIIESAPKGFLPVVTMKEIQEGEPIMVADFRDKVLKNTKLSFFIGYDGNKMVFLEKPIRMKNGIYFGKISKTKIKNYEVKIDEFDLVFV